MGTARRVACALALATGAAPPTVAAEPPTVAAEPPPCWTETRVEPDRAVPGQQVLYRVLIASRDRDVERVEWVAQPSFPGVRTEPLGGASLDARVRDGVRYRLRAEDRALFVERPGPLELAGAFVRCIAGGRELEVPVAPARLEVVPFPAEDRPAGFAGVAGPLSVRLTVTPRAVALGESVRVAVMVRGTGNLWDLAPPYAPGDFPGAELFAERPVLRAVRGVELSLRRSFVYDVVPLRAGALRVPPLRVSWYDPQEGRYRVATRPAATIDVAPAPAPVRPDTTSGRFGRDAAAEPSAEEGVAGTLLAFGLAAVALVVVAVGVARGLRRGAGPRPGPALSAARRARKAGDPRAEAAALERALRAGLARHAPDVADHAPDAILARTDLAPEVAHAARALRDVERARFDPAAPSADAAGVERALAGLRGRGRPSRDRPPDD